MADIWKAPANVLDIVFKVRDEFHLPRLEGASIAMCFTDTKAFRSNRFNWGKTQKFSQFSKIWQANKYDFCLILCADVWNGLLNDRQKEALVDLHLTRCEVDYIPEMDERDRPVKDEWGRIQYTQEVKYDDAGQPKWRVLPLDLFVFTRNVSRYGLWCEEMDEFGKVASQSL